MKKLTDIATIINRQNGDKIKITPTLYYCDFRHEYSWSHCVEICRNKKRTWVVDDSAASSTEIVDAKIKLWELIKPSD
jgi:hypothetical protein